MFFNADPDYVATLDSISLVKLLKRLVIAESRLIGIPLRAASVPLQITIADGGEDGRVEWNGGLSSSDYLPARFSIFQCKAQSLSKNQVKAEILKRQKKGPPKLNHAVAEVLLKKGAYIVFCRERMVAMKRTKLVEAIRAAITEGGSNAKKASAIEVYDANVIADWVTTHPPVALWLASQKHGTILNGFQSHEQWGRHPDLTLSWQHSDEARFTIMEGAVSTGKLKEPHRATYDQARCQIKDHLASDRALVRVFGPSGFGKSRFVYEVFDRAKQVADEIDIVSVIYCDGSVSGNEAVKLTLELADTELPATLIVDECSDELHTKLANLVKRTNSRLRLVTIDIETAVVETADTLLVRVEKADDELIKGIANGIAPKLSDRARNFIADLANGFPRMAVLAAQHGADGQKTFRSVQQIVDRIIWGSKQRSAEAQRALEVASLFEWVPLQDNASDPAILLATELAQMAHPVFVEHLLSFKSRGVITQRGQFVQVGPLPLATRLGTARLNVMLPQQLVRFFQRAPEGLQTSLLKRMKWLDTSPTTLAFAEQLLQSDFLGNIATLSTNRGAMMLDDLVHLAPDLVSKTIEREFGHLTPDELKTASDGRRHLVWSLEKLVFRKQTFDRSARILLKLAAAETENFSNNATEVFKQLFQLYLGGTEAGPSARLLVLDDGLRSSDRVQREICVDALAVMLGTGHFARSGGAEQIGSADALEDWQPRGYSEIENYFKAAVSRLVSIATSDDELAHVAKRHLGLHVRSLLHQLPPAEVRSMIDAVISHSGFWPEALIGISSWLYFDRGKKTPSHTASEIRRMYDDLLPTDLIDLALLYTYGWQSDLHDPDSEYGRDPKSENDHSYALRQAVAVAGKIARKTSLTNLAVQRLACSNGNGEFAFAKELMTRVKGPKALFRKALAVAEASSQLPNPGFFAGLVSGAHERHPQLALALIRLALQSPKLKGEAITLISASTLDSDKLALVISLLRAKDISPRQCQNLGLSQASEKLCLAILRELEQHGNDGLWTIISIVDLYLYDGSKTPSNAFVNLLRRVLIKPSLMDAVRSNTDGYHLQHMVERLAALGTVTENYAKKLAKQCLRICRQRNNNVFYVLDDPVRSILGQLVAMYPQTIWAEIAEMLTSKSWYERHRAADLLETRPGDNHLSRGLSFSVPRHVYLAWVREHPKTRAAIAVAWLPIAEKNDAGQLSWHHELEEFVAEFGHHANVLSAISRRFLPSSFWGGLERYLEPIIPLVQTWAEHPNARVRNWAADQVDWLRQSILDETRRSEERLVRLGQVFRVSS